MCGIFCAGENRLTDESNNDILNRDGLTDESKGALAMSFEAYEKITEEKRNRILSTGIKEFSGKSYKDVSTDHITKACGISKGLLFHYFGSKREFYFYCLEKALERLTARTGDTTQADDFYDVLFSSMDRKMQLCTRYGDEMHLVNMASRDASEEIAERKNEIFQAYTARVKQESSETLKRALAMLDYKDGINIQKTSEGLSIYIHAVLNRYLLLYQQMPDAFFENTEKIREEMKLYLDLMLFGVCREQERKRGNGG